jgi:predicted lipid-binding transport protein (Tim44 family)
MGLHHLLAAQRPRSDCPILTPDAQKVLQFEGLETGRSQPHIAFHSPVCRALSENFSMNKSLVAVLAVAISAALAPGFADAKRLGAGKSSGTQRNMPERTSPTATPATPATPSAAPTAAAAKPATPAAAAPATPPKRNWMGPLAGLAAGLGLAALMSHLGMGAGFANFILIALLAVAAFAAFAYFRRRSQAAKDGMTPAMAGAGAGTAGAAGSATQVAWPSQAANPVQERTALDAPAAGSAGSFEPANSGAGAGTFSLPGKAPVAAAFVPAAFDSESFERIAKAIFIRMQAANDSGNLDDLRQFTTPEMFAEVKLELMERGNAKQTTDVQRVDAKVLDVADEGAHQVVSVRYTGAAIEVAGQAAVSFDEVWHLVKPTGDTGAWLIAGIEQMA